MNTPLKGWRTILFNTVTIFVAGAQMVDPTLFGPQGLLIVTLINSGGNMILRALTNTAVGKSV